MLNLMTWNPSRSALILWALKMANLIAWSEKLAEYFYHPDGRPLGDRQIQENIEAKEAELLNRIDGLTASMLSEGRSLGSWQEGIAKALEEQWKINYMVGRGGRHFMTQSDWGSIGGDLAFQMGKLDNFAREIAAGNLTPGQIEARARMYGRSAWKGYQKGLRAGKTGAMYTEERRVSAGDNRVCGDCADYERLGWQPIGSLPAPGEACACMSNCRCSFEYRSPGTFGQMSDADIHEMMERAQAGGFTYHPMKGEFPTKGLAFSIEPTREMKIPLRDFRPEHAYEFANRNRDKYTAKHKDNHIGGWIAEGYFWYDVSKVWPVSRFDRVVRLCKEFKQKGFYDIGAGKYYDTEEEWIKLMAKAGKNKPRRHGRSARKPEPVKMVLARPPEDIDSPEFDLWAKRFVNHVRKVGGLPPLYDEETGEELAQE